MCNYIDRLGEVGVFTRLLETRYPIHKKHEHPAAGKYHAALHPCAVKFISQGHKRQTYQLQVMDNPQSTNLSLSVQFRQLSVNSMLKTEFLQSFVEPASLFRTGMIIRLDMAEQGQALGLRVERLVFTLYACSRAAGA